MKIEDQFFDVVREEGFYEKYNDLFVPDRLPEDEVKLIKKNLQRLGAGNLVTEKSIFVFGKGCKDIKVNESFDILFSHQNIREAVEVKATLKYVNVSRSRETDYLPKGYSGLCLIEFENQIPDLLNKLSIYGAKKSQGSKFTLYLSEKPIYERLKTLMKIG